MRTKTITAIVSNVIDVDAYLLSEEMIAVITDELTISNPAFGQAKRAKRYEWWKLDEFFYFWEDVDNHLIMPRGYAQRFKEILRDSGYRVQWVERRKWSQGPAMEWAQPFSPRPHQPRAVKAIRKYQQGMYEAPTGSGKSLTVISLMKVLSPMKSIVLTDQKGLLTQWTNEIGKWLGSDLVGQVGSGKWVDDKRITVATVQTIVSKLRRGEIEQDWFDQFDLMAIDEGHHVSAVSYQDLVGRFKSRYRFGVSATPDRKTGLFPIIEAVLGPVFLVEDEQALRDAGVLIKPHVEVIKTDFDFLYWGDEDYDGGECPVPGCKLFHQEHSHKNNYQKLKDAIVSDHERNVLIADTIWKISQEGPHHQLIVTDEIRHIEAMYMALAGSYTHADGLPAVRFLTGQGTKNSRESAIQEIKESQESITFATVAKEGLDITVIDRIHLPWPHSNPGKTQQWLGRATRVSEGKTDAIVYDYWDGSVKKLKQQFRRRRFECYDKLGLEVVRNW